MPAMYLSSNFKNSCRRVQQPNLENKHVTFKERKSSHNFQIEESCHLISCKHMPVYSV